MGQLLSWLCNGKILIRAQGIVCAKKSNSTMRATGFGQVKAIQGGGRSLERGGSIGRPPQRYGQIFTFVLESWYEIWHYPLAWYVTLSILFIIPWYTSVWYHTVGAVRCGVCVCVCASLTTPPGSVFYADIAPLRHTTLTLSTKRYSKLLQTRSQRGSHQSTKPTRRPSCLGCL